MGVAGAASIVALSAWTLFRAHPSRVAIEGPSMAPTLLPGDWALVVNTCSIGRGDVVVVEHPGRSGYEIVKRVTALPGDTVGERILGEDEFWVEGDSARTSTDSRRFGPVTREAIKAKVLLVYWPRDRQRMVR